MEERVLFFVELAAGIVVGFMIWSYVAPSFGSINTTPNA